MNHTTFASYALCRDLSEDETYTVEMLIERVRFEICEDEPDFWDKQMKRDEAREVLGYVPSFERNLVQSAEKALSRLSWLSFQGLGRRSRPIRDLTALRFLLGLETLVLSENNVSDLSPLAGCPALRDLTLSQNPIRDLSPLTECSNLEELGIGGTLVDDFAPLERMPKLRRLFFRDEQIPLLKRVKRLPALRRIGFGTIDSFEGFPDMPELREVSAKVDRLDGLERFARLENLVNFSGEFSSLEPLRHLKHLTHVNILESRVESVEPLSQLLALRRLSLNTSASKIDLTPVAALPALHELSVKCAGEQPAELTGIRASLSSWDTEFRSEKPRHTPSLELEVVSKETFDYFDSKALFNRAEHETNEGLLSSEVEWIDGCIEEVLEARFSVDDDFAVPFQWQGGRSRTVVLYSDEAVDAFAQLVLGFQKALAHATNDWILYFQTDGPDREFVVWVYPDKIIVTEEYADTVRELITPR